MIDNEETAMLIERQALHNIPTDSSYTSAPSLSRFLMKARIIRQWLTEASITNLSQTQSFFLIIQ